MKKYTIIALVVLVGVSCENRDVNSGSGPAFSEIHEDIHYHFDKVALDGSEYFILERDRNNPHEGFGFMALKGNDIKANQDSIKAYLKTLLDFQVKMNARMSSMTDEETEAYANDLFQYYLDQSKSPFHIQKSKRTKKPASN